MRWYLLIGAAAFLAGCVERHSYTVTSATSQPAPSSQSRLGRTIEQFEFLQPGMVMTEVTNRIGLPDLETSYDHVSWIYGLADGSTLTIVPRFIDYSDFETWRVDYFCQYRGGDLLWRRPDENK